MQKHAYSLINRRELSNFVARAGANLLLDNNSSQLLRLVTRARLSKTTKPKIGGNVGARRAGLYTFAGAPWGLPSLLAIHPSRRLPDRALAAGLALLERGKASSLAGQTAELDRGEQERGLSGWLAVFCTAEKTFFSFFFFFCCFLVVLIGTFA